jgi:signal recognition particle subunit SRP54
MTHKDEFTLETFAKMLKRTFRPGPLGRILGMLPGGRGRFAPLEEPGAEKEMRQLLGVIDAMTPAERRGATKLIDASRRNRIAAGAGVDPQQVHQLIQQFDGMVAMMRERDTRR